MNEDEIRHWSKQYDEDYGDELHAIEQKLTRAIDEQQYVIQDQLEEIIRWKMANQGGRPSLNITRMESVPDEFIQKISRAALLIDNPKIQLKTLMSIPGIGSATATVVLTFSDPANYAVGDRYLIDLFFEEDRQMRVTDYPKILEELRAKAPPGIELRTVEKAFYQRYRDEHGL